MQSERKQDNEKTPAWRMFAIMIATVGSLCALLVMSGRGYFNRPAHSGMAVRRELQERMPSVVIVGNSLVKEGVDEQKLSEMTGRSVMNIHAVGSGSAFWYLALKNAVVASGADVKMAVIVFADDSLTKPDAGVYGYPKKHLDYMAGKSEPLLDELAYWRQMGFFERWLTRYFPVYRIRNESRMFVEKATRLVVSWLVPEYDKYDVDETMERVFSDNRMIPAMVNARQLADKQEKRTEDFDVAVTNSFLPAIIETLKEAGIKPCFIRYKTRRLAEGRQDDANMAEYQLKLKQYLEANGAALLDLSNEKRIKISHYAFGDHYNQAGCNTFTGLIGEWGKHILPLDD